MVKNFCCKTVNFVSYFAGKFKLRLYFDYF